MCGAGKAMQKNTGMRFDSTQGKRPMKKTGIAVSVARCKNCGLVYTNPMPVPENISDHYGVEPEAYWKEDYFRIPENHYSDELSVLKKLTKNKKPLRVLDIGAGIGKVMLTLEKEGYDVYGIEASETFYKTAIDKMDINSEKLHCGMIEDAEYPVSHFDFINLGAVLEHLYNPDKILKKLMKWLKPGGLIFVSVPSSRWLMAKLMNFLYSLQGLDYVSNLSPMHQPYHLYEFGLKSFILNGKKNNYKVVHHQVYVCDTFAPKVFDKPLRWIMRKQGSGLQLLVCLKKT